MLSACPFLEATVDLQVASLAPQASDVTPIRLEDSGVGLAGGATVCVCSLETVGMAWCDVVVTLAGILPN
jgi:hypothetical protein